MACRKKIRMVTSPPVVKFEPIRIQQALTYTISLNVRENFKSFFSLFSIFEQFLHLGHEKIEILKLKIFLAFTATFFQN